MSTFDDRQKGYENKFVHDQEMALKVAARRNKLLGLWAAEKLGKQKDEAETYGNNLAISTVEDRRKDMTGRVYYDLQKAGSALSLKDVLVEYERLYSIAQQQLLGDK